MVTGSPRMGVREILGLCVVGGVRRLSTWNEWFECQKVLVWKAWSQRPRLQPVKSKHSPGFPVRCLLSSHVAEGKRVGSLLSLARQESYSGNPAIRISFKPM